MLRMATRSCRSRFVVVDEAGRTATWLPGVRSPSRTSVDVAVPGGAELRGGEFRQPGLASTPSVASSALRIGGVRFRIDLGDHGDPANMPVLSVDDRMVSHQFRAVRAFAHGLGPQHQVRKVRFHSCGGTQGISTCSTCRTDSSIDRRRRSAPLEHRRFARSGLVDQIEGAGNAPHRLTQRRQPWQDLEHCAPFLLQAASSKSALFQSESG